MFPAILLVPLLGVLALASSRWTEATARIVATAVASVPLLLLVIAWIDFDPGGPMFQNTFDVPWIPVVGAGFRLGVDGTALMVATMSALLFTVAIAYPVDYHGKARQYFGWLLFLESVSLGLFLALDLLLFYVFFDLSLVGMYFLVALFGHEQRERAALKFLLYTLLGSLVMLLGILSLVLATDPLSFDMRVLIERQPLATAGRRADLTFLAILFGLAVKAPLVPVHTWLPAAHVQAPAPVSAILAGVLLKMGTYGMIRVAYAPMQATFTTYAPWIGIAAVVSVVYGAFVALGQQHLKRRIAYTSITHMGYTVLGIAVALSVPVGNDTARRVALTGATLEMIAHGLITGALFLITGSLWQRTQSFEMNDYGGVAARAPKLTGFTTIAVFASLGLPGLAGFVAEFQIFTGSLAIEPWLPGIALLGVLITAALFLQLLQQVFFGRMKPAVARISDLGPAETAVLTTLLGLTIILGVAPALVIDVLDATSRGLVGVR